MPAGVYNSPVVDWEHVAPGGHPGGAVLDNLTELESTPESCIINHRLNE